MEPSNKARKNAKASSFAVDGYEDKAYVRVADVTPNSTPKTEVATSKSRHLCLYISRCITEWRSRSAWEWLCLFLPCASWLRTYSMKHHFLSDLIAGISVSFLLIPQAMSYANLAGLPSVFGLYSAFLPPLMYALTGSSRQLAIGPSAISSLVVANNLRELVPGAHNVSNPNALTPDLVAIQTEYNHSAIQLAMLVGVIYLFMSATKMGFITQFLSKSVMGGFMSGAAIVIAMSQLKYILGYNIMPKSSSLIDTVSATIDNIHLLRWQEAVMGSTIIILLLTMRALSRNYPKLSWMGSMGPITACAIGLGAVYIGGVDQNGILTIRAIPEGFPPPTISWFWSRNPTNLIPAAFIVILVGLMESMSIATKLANKNGYKLNENQELAALGFANLVGSAFSASPVNGSLSRSVVSNDAGAKTGMAGFITGSLVGVALLVLTPIFEHLPFNVLAAIVISSVIGLVDFSEPWYLFKVNKVDCTVWLISFIGCVFFSINLGISLSIGFALLAVIYTAAKPQVSVLGRVPGSTVYRCTDQYPGSIPPIGVVVVRVHAAIFFANTEYIKNRIMEYVEQADAAAKLHGTRLQHVLLDMSPVTNIDATGLLEMSHWADELSHRGLSFALINPSARVCDKLHIADIPDHLGDPWMFVCVHDAVEYCKALVDGQATVGVREGKVVGVDGDQGSVVGTSRGKEATEIRPRTHSGPVPEIL